ncbi:hypothetical protein B0H19DRAFT_1253661 [Mycena capillaripes]|nr:hypothetical protein B0H19DRAFT_1253661 [Mycena capillaripes]
MPAPPIHQYIQLICRGSKVWYHAGLEYQGHNCGYFRWLAPDLLADAERRVQDGPAGGAPPYPPQDYPPEPWAHSPSLPSYSMALDPALATSSTAPPSTQPHPFSSPSSMPPPTQLTQSGKPKCAVKPCQKVAGSQHCTHQMCKQCCEQQQKGCAYTGHRKNQIIVPMSSFSTADPGDPSALSRPTPMHSYEYLAPSKEAPLPSLPPKLHKKPMDPEWARRYNKNHEAQEQRRIAEEERRQQDLMFERQVRFCFWEEDGVEPTMFCQQGLKTLRFNMASRPELLKKMGLVATDEIGIYDFDGRCWDCEDVDHVREVVAHEVLLVRRFGVTDCPRLDEYITKYAPKPVITRRALPAAPTHQQKREISSPTEQDRRPSKVPRISPPPSSPPSPIFSALSMSSSRTSRSSSPTLLSWHSSSEPPIHSPSFSRSITQPSAAPIDYDNLWKRGHVLNPDGCGTWPEGMYARNMAAAFRLVGSKQVAESFTAVFGIPFPSGTWYQQQRAWKKSSQGERDKAAELPRTADGLYTVWRDTSSGWAHILKEKKRQS